MALQTRQSAEPQGVMPDQLLTFSTEQWADDEVDDASELAEAYDKIRARQAMRSQPWRVMNQNDQIVALLGEQATEQRRTNHLLRRLGSQLAQPRR